MTPDPLHSLSEFSRLCDENNLEAADLIRDLCASTDEDPFDWAIALPDTDPAIAAQIRTHAEALLPVPRAEDLNDLLTFLEFPDGADDNIPDYLYRSPAQRLWDLAD